MLFDLDKQPKRRFFYELYLIAVIAMPMMISQLAQVGTGFVDTLMSGWAGKEDLAAVGLGSGIFVTILITLFGIPTALNPILSQSFGAKRFDVMRREAQQGFFLCTIVGIVGIVILWLLCIPLQNILKWSDYAIKTTVWYLYAIAAGLPAAILHRAFQSYAAALGRTMPVMWIGVIGLILNIPLNYILINGLYGLPRMGGAGCGAASAIVFWFNTICLYLYFIKNKYFRQFELNRDWSLPSWQDIAPILRLGLPICFSFFLEVSLFTFITMLIANSGVQFVAAQQIVMTIGSVLYMLPQSLGASISARIGQSLGAKQRKRAYYISGVCIVAGAIGAAFAGIALAILRVPLVSLFTSDSEIILIGANLLLFSAIYQVVDATQTIASGALRGYRITVIPMLIHMVSFWILGLGLGYILAFWIGWGLYGFWCALVISLTVASLALTGYLIYIARKKITHHFV